MTLAEFMNKYPAGTRIDFDGAYGAQCVDLFRRYNQDVNELPHTGPCNVTGGAVDLVRNYSHMPVEKKYYKCLKTTTPRPGDVAVWPETSKNKYGHVAIVIYYDAALKSVLVMEQDGIQQNGVQYKYRDATTIEAVLRLR